MRIFGLTGGIASGKSTVRRMLEARGATVLDADVLAREVVEPGRPALIEIAARFPDVVSASGVLDRAALAKRVFSDDAARATLNRIIHPRIATAFAERRAVLQAQGLERVVYDAALLIENGLHEKLDGVLLVTAPLEVQRARLIARDGLTVTEADARLSAQWPLARKIPFARWLVDNGGAESKTEEQVDRVWAEMQRL